MPSVIPPSPTLDDQFFWDAIADGYEELAARMTRGYSTHGMSRGVRSATRWEPELRAADASRTSFLLEESR